MADSTTDQGSSRPKSRQSIAHMPSAKTAASRDNATTDIAALQARHTEAKAAKKKSRGKSLGPGGLEALKESTGNATKVKRPYLVAKAHFVDFRQTTTPFQIKSILKPSIPLTPPKAIPSFDELRKRSTGKDRPQAKSNPEELLIDFSTPGPGGQDGGAVSMSGAENVADPFSPIVRRSPRKTDGASGSAEVLERQQEEERKRLAEKEAILERRAARRKSLANRRVSFAPEATLHTWSVMELAEDSTTSSASNSTRRQSSMTAAQSPIKSIGSPETANASSTPAELTGELLVKESPAKQSNVSQKKRRRRSSGLAEPMLDDVEESMYSSSPSGDVTTDSSPVRVEEGIESSDESDTDGDTAMSLEDGTSHTVASEDSGSSTPSSLEERLRQAADQAGTRGIEYDEHGEDFPMEMVTGTVTNAFQNWAQGRAHEIANDEMLDPENLDPYAASLPAKQENDVEIEDESDDQSGEMSMDVTSAVGGIVTGRSPSKTCSRSPVARRRSSIRRRRSSGNESTFDETMDFTVMQGGIISAEAEQTVNSRVSDEDISMEFTHAAGGVLSGAVAGYSMVSEHTEENLAMDMTTAVGGILPPIEEQTEPQTDVEEQTVAMDMTRAVGGILPNNRVTRQSPRNATFTSPRRLPAEETKPKSPPKTHQHRTSIASETGSPSLALKPRLSGRSQRSAAKAVAAPLPEQQNSTPVKSQMRTQQGTPSKQVTPLPPRAETPNKTPSSANVSHRTASPKKLFKAEIKARTSPASAKRNALFSPGKQTPSVILKAPKPQIGRRRSSGIGIDKDGIGSPRVTELLNRRSSIGDAAPQFKLVSIEPTMLHSEDPQQLVQEVEAERAEEQRRESGRFIMEQEADEPQDENLTLQLKDMIESMTPQKPKSGKLKGRKSLAVGGAKGLLGKRPAELDMDDDDEADSTPKRLRVVSREGSPVKKVHLPKPPSKDETTGRLGTKLQKSLQEMTDNDNATPNLGAASPSKNVVALSPATTKRFKDIKVNDEARPESFEDKLDNVVGAIDISTVQMEEGSARGEEAKISLQQFLNMTNIHFIELSTTKRRHTIAQSTPAAGSQTNRDGSDTADNFVAAATTLPLLELYQHATRELKSYISAGRKIIRSIEAETLADQPPLFREYIDARPDVKIVMDNQFRNGKANARLQSKEGWYQWRAQLVEGLKNGLEGIDQGMQADLQLLQQQQLMLDSVLPQLNQERIDLECQRASLQQSLEELDSVHHESLTNCRRELQNADEYCLQRSTLLESLREQMREKEEALLAAAELKSEMKDQITEADRVREENKGWPVADVLSLRSKVDAIEKQTGWRLITAEEDIDGPTESGPALTMIYKDHLRLFFYPQAFQYKASDAPRRRSGRRSASTSGPNAPISLTYAPADLEDSDANPSEPPTEKRFFLQLVRSQLHAYAMMPKRSVSPRTMLSTVSQGWDLACKISEELRLLNLVGIATVSILSDEKLGVKLMLITPEHGRIDIEFAITVAVLNDGDIVASTSVTAHAVYGRSVELLSGGKGRKVQHALGREAESRVLGEGAFVGAIHGLEEWLCGQDKVRQETKKEEVMIASVPKPVDSPKTTAGPSTLAPASAPAAPKRSPLAPKRTNPLQKKALPVPKQRLEKINPQPLFQHHQDQHHPSSEKENFKQSLSISGKVSSHHPLHRSQPEEKGTVDATAGWEQIVPRAAIPPEMQEAMMHTTPIKRVGALRRSPI
ncbi:uncharacterized protein Z519_00382 [Cladophialophora bantiana CBS 173.52]|uniref:Spc7 kinetochore protein domain-containing protein n=1 Tax=Cladophialophora bantiana (strain ATCC 10958 / CBS 173.52 / CDC B-1940 / NIH 8579) TaxID=1442370 RepID=A0A0D2IPI9_CLAB1|nr:uncharacterized protein Z519_00382 [Cladophialophora bantiana CBS 173.52]KIW98719.1 hypothetical protein Z519_00382 [Cladophialophora bantiana CBS 173.52]